MLRRRLLLVPLALAGSTALPSAQEVAERALAADGSVVLRTPEPLSVYDALELARAAGGTLVAIESAEEETWLLDNFGATEPYWIGLEFPRASWQNGAALGFTHWAHAEPNGGTRQLFTLMNWDPAEPGAWGDASGDATQERFRALIEVPAPGRAALPALPTRPVNRGVLLLAIQGLMAKDLQSSKNPNLNELWRRSTWTFDAGADGSGDPLAGLGMLLWGVGSARSGLDNANRASADRATNENLLTRLEQTRPEVTTAALFDDPALTGILVDGRIDLRVSNASPRKPGGTQEPLKDALSRATPLCLVATWTEFLAPDSEEPGEAQRARAIAAIDGELGTLLAGLRARAGFAEEDWFIALAGIAPVAQKKPKADDDPRKQTAVPLLLVSPSAPPGEILSEVLLVDLVPTLLAHLGVEVRRGWQLDGRVLALDQPIAYGENLLVNAGAEAQFGWGRQARFPLLTGWRSLAPFRMARYDDGEAGPERRGQSYFEGVQAPLARIEQTIDLGAIGADVEHGDVRFELAGWLGGHTVNQAPIELAVEFLDERRKEVGRSAAGPIGPVQRGQALGLQKGVPVDGLIHVEVAGKVPRRTRMARVILSAVLPGRIPQAMADELSLVLQRGD